jgi:hypothetical protein
VGDCETSVVAGSPSRALARAEVEDLHLARRRDLDIGRLQVAVNNALLVRRVQRVGDLMRERDGFIVWESASDQSIGERLTLDELHHEGECGMPGFAGAVFDPVNAGNVRVVQRRQHPGLTLEARPTIGLL